MWVHCLHSLFSVNTHVFSTNTHTHAFITHKRPFTNNPPSGQTQQNIPGTQWVSPSLCLPQFCLSATLFSPPHCFLLQLSSPNLHPTYTHPLILQYYPFTPHILPHLHLVTALCHFLFRLSVFCPCLICFARLQFCSWASKWGPYLVFATRSGSFVFLRDEHAGKQQRYWVLRCRKCGVIRECLTSCLRLKDWAAEKQRVRLLQQEVQTWTATEPHDMLNLIEPVF